MIRQLCAAALVALAMVLVPSNPSRASTSGVPSYDHVFVIVMENHSYDQIIGSSSAPYINSLLASGELATNYYGVTHPSLPNYLALTGGSTFGITTDCNTCWVSASNLGDSLESVGASWKAYMESMPAPCYVGDSYPYVQKHDPFIYFDDIRNNVTRCRSHVVPYSQLATDLSSTTTTPSFAFITPNICNDMHDCTIETGDSWLRQQVPQILSSSAFTSQRSLLAITWDEDDFTAVNRVPLILLGSQIAGGTRSATTYNHYSLLNAIELARGAPFLTASDSGASSMSAMFTSPAAPPCTSAGLALSPPSPSSVGTAVQMTATSSGCANAEYRFFIQAPGQGWTPQTPYQGATWTWSTAGLPAGVYGVGVWARQIGSGSAYEAYWIGTYSIGVTTCDSAELSPSSASPQPVGTQITWTAASARCPTPQFRFWILPPGGTWVMERDYGSPTWTWNTAGLAPGTYEVGVWSRQAGSTAAYDDFAITTFLVGSGTCTAAMSANLVPPQPPVGSVVFSVASTGCGSAEYQYWIKPAGGLWTVAQPFTPQTLWNWSIAGIPPGTYQVGTWVRESGSPNSYDAFYVMTYEVGYPACSAATISVSPSSPQPPSTALTAGATAIGCSAPQYEFWLLLPNATQWTSVQTYSASAVFNWNTSGLASGPYRVGVWARANSSLNAYDAYAIVTYWLGN